MDAFDADVLIYAAARGHALGARIRPLFGTPGHQPVGVGSILLEPELLIKPYRDAATEELGELRRLVARLELFEVTAPIADLAVDLGARYRMKAMDAIHLATATVVGADRFVTNNQRDFPRSIAEIDIVYPDDLPPA